jgi:hypothetical protein
MVCQSGKLPLGKPKTFAASLAILVFSYPVHALRVGTADESEKYLGVCLKVVQKVILYTCLMHTNCCTNYK